MRRDLAERKALRRLKTRQEESHNRPQCNQTRTKLEEKIVALVKALARAAAEADFRLERERENGRTQ
ncbi:MAG: hypothetical protein IPO55_03090 [Alphaproteobacteria bacterium]|nr:hypothetical protein [Alphaproteobacteria bacterium]